MRELQNHIALITGGGTGLGREVSVELAEKGATVIILGRTESKLKETKEIIENNGGKCEYFIADVTDRDRVFEVVQNIKDTYGRLDILHPNAGQTTMLYSIENTPIEDFRGLIETHLFGTINVIQAAVPVMKENKYGRIILCASIGAIRGLIANQAYSTAKASMSGLMYALAKELGPHGITVNTIQPGIIRSDMTTGFNEKEAEFSRATAMARFGEPSDVANVVCFLASPKTSFITGVNLPIDGGITLRLGADEIMSTIIGQ